MVETILPLTQQAFERRELETESSPSDIRAITSALVNRSEAAAQGAIVCWFVILFALIVIVAAFIMRVIPLAGIGLLVWIFAGMKIKNFSQANVPNERMILTNQVVSLLERDLESNSTLYINVGFRPTLDDANKVGGPPRTVRRDRSYYENTWFTVKGRLADGTKLSIRLTELMQRKFRKAKQKDKGSQIELLLSYPEKRYGSMETFGAKARSAFQLPQGTTIKSLRVKDGAIKLVVALGASSGSNMAERWSKTIKLMLMSSYQLLNLGKTLKKSAGG